MLTVYAYVLTRLASPECETESEAIKALEKCGISKESLITEDQSNCTIC